MNSRACILLVSVGCILFARSLVAQMETFVPANDVSFSLSTERKSYRTGEQINLQYRIKNISNGPLYAPREGEAKCPGNRHVWVWFENSTGNTTCQAMGFLRPRRQSENRYRAHDARSRLAQTR